MDEKLLLILATFVEISPNRLKILECLSRNDVLIPTDIAKATGIHINSVSKQLRYLREKRLVYLLNPDYKRGRLYRITDLGIDVLNFLNAKEK